MNMKQREWGVEKRKQAVGGKGAQTNMVQQTELSPTEPYNVVNANLRKFWGILRHCADFAPTQGAHEHEAKRMES